MMGANKVEPIKHHLLAKELVEELQAAVDVFNRRSHRGIHATPLAKFATDPTPIRKLPERLVALALLPRRAEKTIQKAGIQHTNVFYRHPRLNRHVGRRVEIAFTDRDPSYVHVFLDGRYLCKALTTPSRAMAGGLKASRARQVETFNRIELGAEKLRLERAGLDADDFDLEVRRRERKNRRQKTSSSPTAQAPQRLSSRRAAHLKDETWKAG
jgi:hypothetical protein